MSRAHYPSSAVLTEFCYDTGATANLHQQGVSFEVFFLEGMDKN